jgi:hypothetical protein
MLTNGFVCLLLLVCIAGCSNGTSNGPVMFVPGGTTITVNSLEDLDSPPAGAVTLRSALARIGSGGTITFDQALNGSTINLAMIGATNSLLKGEVFTFSQGTWKFLGYQERDYGRSALYARKDVTIDASNLPAGITLKWVGGDTNRARVLALYGNLTMKKVTVTGGHAGNEAISGGTQPFTLARGGGLAVWGTATLEQCTIDGNLASGDETPSRDRGAFGGGIYAERLVLSDCIISGNSATGFGAAGGGVYSVGGIEATSAGSTLTRCTVSGNRVTGQHAYGGGVYSDGGGPGNMKTLIVSNSTVARNMVSDHPGIAENAMFQYYYRGGGIYMSNGSLMIRSSTIAENAVSGNPATFSGKPNMGGGGIAATIGDAHVVENMQVWHNIIAGNSVNGGKDDLFTGSLLHFYSYGYNLIGRLDFSQILVPIPEYYSLSRKHWPKIGDRHGVPLSDAVSLATVTYHPVIVSAGTDAGQPALLWYPPSGSALNSIPAASYTVDSVLAQYTVVPGGADDFLNLVRDRVRTDYAALPGTSFGTLVGDMTGILWYGPATTWPSNPLNVPWIAFWKNIDAELGTGLDPVRLGDDFWGTFTSGPWGENIIMTVGSTRSSPITLLANDQRGILRAQGVKGAIGALEP